MHDRRCIRRQRRTTIVALSAAVAFGSMMILMMVMITTMIVMIISSLLAHRSPHKDRHRHMGPNSLPLPLAGNNFLKFMTHKMLIIVMLFFGEGVLGRV